MCVYVCVHAHVCICVHPRVRARVCLDTKGKSGSIWECWRRSGTSRTGHPRSGVLSFRHPYHCCYFSDETLPWVTSLV